MGIRVLDKKVLRKQLIQARLDLDSETYASKSNFIVSKLKQQQTIYAPLMPYFQTGEIHALTIKTYTTAKWKMDRLLHQAS